jgi:putative membrane protein
MIRATLMAAGALALVACGQQAAKTETAEAPAAQAPVAPLPQPAMTDAEFIQAAAAASAFEIQSSELAAAHAARRDVKDYATTMMRDHRAATQELTTLTSANNLAAPTPMLSAMQAATLESLRGKTGEAFDAAYLDAQVAAHQSAVQAFESYAAGAAAGPLRDWANATLPKLREHLSSAQQLQNAT